MSDCAEVGLEAVINTLEVGSRHVAARGLNCFSLLFKGSTGVQWWNGREVLGRVVNVGRPIGRRPGKLGHSGVRNWRARELLLKVTLQLQAKSVSSGGVVSRDWLRGRTPKDRIRKCWHTQVSRRRLRLRGRLSRIEYKVL